MNVYYASYLKFPSNVFGYPFLTFPSLRTQTQRQMGRWPEGSKIDPMILALYSYFS